MSRKMIKINVLLVIFIFFIIPYSAFANSQFIFRHTYWGMSPNEVIKSESPRKYKINGHILSFKDKMLGYDVSILYYFEYNKLIGSQIIFNGIKSNEETKKIMQYINNNYIKGCNKVANHWENDKNVKGALVVTRLAGSENEETYECNKYRVNFKDVSLPGQRVSKIHQFWIYFGKNKKSPVK